MYYTGKWKALTVSYPWAFPFVVQVLQNLGYRQKKFLRITLFYVYTRRQSAPNSEVWS